MTKKINLEETVAYQKVLNWYFAFPSIEMGLNDLVAKLKISKTTAKKVVEHFVKIGFLKREIIGRVWRLSCVQDHFFMISKKIPHNLSLIYDSQILNEIRKKIPNSKSIILFGSYRKGDDTENSDIDIAVEISGDQDVKITELYHISELGYRKNVLVNLHVFSRKKINLNLFSNIANGIVLDGFLEVKP